MAEIAPKSLESQVAELNIRLKAEEQYKKIGLAIALGMLLIRLFKG